MIKYQSGRRLAAVAALLIAMAASSNAHARFSNHSSSMAASNGTPTDAGGHTNSPTSSSGRIGAFLFRHRISELQGMIATQQVELQKLARFPHVQDLPKIAALQQEIARETRQLHFLQGV
jgi:hypothetical protein